MRPHISITSNSIIRTIKLLEEASRRLKPYSPFIEKLNTLRNTSLRVIDTQESLSIEKERDLRIKKRKNFNKRTLWLKEFKRHGYVRFTGEKNILLCERIVLYFLWEQFLYPNLHISLRSVCDEFEDENGKKINADSVKSIAYQKKEKGEYKNNYLTPGFVKDLKFHVFDQKRESLLKN